MKIDFDTMAWNTVPHMYDGEKELKAKTYQDDSCRILRGILVPGASIGLHTHKGNSEIVYVLKGTGTMLCDGVEETLPAGVAHYCPEGHTHSFMNRTQEDVEFFAVIPQK